jgi:RHS repeat-associated protein
MLLAGASAAPVALFDYLPFGGELASGGSDPGLLIYRYAGQEWDAETSLYNDRHRLYDPSIARFYAPDPRRQYFSPYLYVADHPLLLTDPSGELGSGNLLGIGFATAQLGAGAFLVGFGAATGNTTMMAVGGAAIGGGVAGVDYSMTTRHWSESQYWQIDAAATISTAEMEAGMLITAASGGLAKSVGGGLIGAGASGYASVLMQVNEDPNQKFSWKQWGIAEGTGFVTGFVAGGLGAALGPAADTAAVEGSEAGEQASVGSEVGDSASDSGSEQAGDDNGNGKGRFNTRNYWRSIGAKTAGRFAGGMAGETFNYSVTHQHFNAGTWIIDSLTAGLEQASAQFVMGLVFEAYVPESGGGKLAYQNGQRAVRSGIGYGWSQLVKQP